MDKWRKYTLFEGFIAAALHDIGKMALKNNTWVHHWDLIAVGKRTGIDFVELLGENVVDLISIHHGNVKNEKIFDFTKLSKIEYALILSDKIQSSMLPNEDKIKEVVGEDKISEIKSREKYFVPYYGTLEIWNDSKANSSLKEIFGKLEKSPTPNWWANNILKIQDKLLNYPFKTLLPHLSLAMHHQLSAALFLFLCDELEKYDDLRDFKEFSFSVIEITPDSLRTFYRMREVSGLHSLTEKLSTEILNKLFGHYRSKLNGIPHKKSNPFLFYNKNSLVLLHPSHETVLEKLSEVLNGLDLFFSLTVNVNEYSCAIDLNSDTKTSHKNIFVRGHRVIKRYYTILSDKILSDSPHQDYICTACGKPIEGDKKEDDKGHVLCDFCYNLRKKSTGYDLDVIGGEGERLSYIFLKLPDDLVEHSQKVAEEKLISRFLAECRIDPYLIPPTDCGILEYLQALRELSLFQEDVDGLIIGDYEKTLFNSPQFTGYLFRETETQPWDFLRYLNTKRLDLRLNPSLVLMSCNTKTPFWSLIESMPTYNSLNGDVIYDISGGCVTMFQSDEVSRIRELAETARNSNVTSTQLNSLSGVAMNTSIDELLLELDTREDKLREFGKRLADAINQLKPAEGEYQNRIKRAIFIKYIGKLVPRSKNRYNKRRR
ncbi:MAG: hypothetical protein AEth_01087 [Candidatus Argoarchaeum ethanivorans]|uniref:HD domain-containing protein n=1 Tax=Candidatus Argoarchaeum ethanivorans TaxID=2608793 RepID=A0A8B3S383_9EURY|nr:MAG: hypothetical protein AEth_01087 [Candidatus Argoarchaeum ethanivorans]